MTIDELTETEIKEIENMWSARQRGLYYNTEKVTNMYNKLLNANLTPSNCGSCIRKRIDAIWSKYNQMLNEKEDGKENQEIQDSATT